MKINKKQKGGHVAQRDNTRVVWPIIQKKLTQEESQSIQQRKLQELSKRKQAYMYDADKAKYYRDLQNFYNYNVFGYGLQGRPTRFDPSTPEGRRAISSTFNYARGNALDFLANVSSAGISSGIGSIGRRASQVYSKLTKGVFKPPSSNGALGTLKQYANNPIGGGAEAVVIKNTPTTVGKITSIPVEEMAARNSIPNTIKSKYIGYVKDRKIKLPTYIQQKVKVLTDETFPKYVDKLDKAMERSGFTRVNDPNVQYRAYTNGQVVIDDVSPGNVGLTLFGQPKMIDFNLQPISEWVAQGFKLHKGGKL